MAKFRRLGCVWKTESKGQSMSTTHEDKSIEKPRQRGRKGGQRDRKAGSQRTQQADQRDEVQTDAMIASAVAETGAAAPDEQALVGEAEPAGMVPVEQVAAAVVPPVEAVAAAGEQPPVNMQTIANAYRDYTRESVQENRRFVERLMGVRSLDKAVEVQTDFATQAYANFVAQSQRICGLYSQLAGQALRFGKRHA
jgi:hypothetical protein